MTEWRVCPDWPEYAVSEHGDVRRMVRRKGNEGLRKPYRASNGYLTIVMRGEGREKAEAVHRLVARAFIGPAATPAHNAAHTDGNRTNNHYSNLSWVTRSENERHKVAHGTSNRGERNRAAVLTQEQVREIKGLLGKQAQRAIAAQFGVKQQTISSIARGDSWSWL